MTKAVSRNSQFGQAVWNEAQRLQKDGKDPNQTANILCQQDPDGFNYGIGIMLDGAGKPMATSPTLLDTLRKEIEKSGAGTYLNSSAKMESLKQAVLDWQRIPRHYQEHFHLALPSDAGTGAVQTAVEFALLLKPTAQILAFEALGWPAYHAIAKSLRLTPKETETDEGLSIYQAGPLNTTGEITSDAVLLKRAQSAAASNSPVILDRAYSGFEFAGRLQEKTYDGIMKMSFEKQIKPFIEQGATFALALSPTKAFVTFSLRPCGFLLVFTPDKKRGREVGLYLNTLIRARGSSFEHPVTRAFVKAFVESRDRLEKEHEAALQRVAETELQWRELARGTPMENQFSDRYAGLFRNPPVRMDAPPTVYNAHLYPVFSQNRCRLNITGLPSDKELARRHVEIFSRACA